ncbi:MAG: hypothetical protein IJU77_11925 [Butyrivibrio sp.]|nr:hypothetical protein [Butyrivibrio sp.]
MEQVNPLYKLRAYSVRPLLLLIGAFVFIWFINLITPSIIPIHGLASVLYGALVLIWGVSVSWRIPEKNVSRLLNMGAILTCLLFVLRLSRWNFFDYSEAISRYLWYLMYIPFLFVPLLSFFAAVLTKNRNSQKPLKHVLFLLPVTSLLLILVLTNDITGAIFSIEYKNGGYTYHYRPVYYFIVVWEIVISILVFVVLMKCCNLSLSRRRWYVPAGLFATGLSALLAYMIHGGSFYLHGINLYNIQEVWAFIFTVPWEACIFIGLLPSNSGYGALFSASHVGAGILDKKGSVIYVSENFDLKGSANTVVKKHSINGGEVLWTEDHTGIIEANRKLKNLTEEMIAENELIEEENKIAAEKNALMERNRLYETIAKSLEPELTGIRKLLTKKDNSSFDKESIIEASILGVYVKRRANLMFLADKGKAVSSTELFLSIRETMEYLELGGCATELTEDGSMEIPGKFVLLSYDLFKDTVMASRESMHACLVKIHATDSFKVTIQTDAVGFFKAKEWHENELASCGLMLTEQLEDDTVTISIFSERRDKS